MLTLLFSYIAAATYSDKIHSLLHIVTQLTAVSQYVLKNVETLKKKIPLLSLSQCALCVCFRKSPTLQ